MSNYETVPFEDYVAERPDIQEVIHRVTAFDHGSMLYRRRPGNSPEAIPGYLGTGRDKRAFRVGGQVVKIVSPEWRLSPEDQVDASRRALGIVGVEQLVTASMKVESGVMVTDFVDGVSPGNLSARHLTRWDITPESVAYLAETLEAMRERGVYVDSAEASLMIVRSDPKGPRFVVIDPVNDSDYGVNTIEEVLEEVAAWKASKNPNHSVNRPSEDAHDIRVAFAAARAGNHAYRYRM